MKGRKNGCPVNIKNWLIFILNAATKKYVRIYGLTSLTRNVDSNTEDGSADTDAWEEPYVTKRKGSLTLEGRPVVEEATGNIDAGQDILNSYADAVGCDGDATLKVVDPYGHAFCADFIVTSREESADDSGTTLSWDLEQVGEVEVLPYTHVESIELKIDGTAATTAEMNVGDPSKLVNIAFTPEEPSNTRFKISNTKRSVATIGNITESGFSITPVAAGTTEVVVTTVNGGKTATLTVTVS